MLRCGIDPAAVQGLVPDNYLYECARIEEYTIPDNVNVVGECAFYNCPNLTKLIIPEGVTDLYNDSIVKCRSLTSIILPSTIEFMGHFVFDECVNLSDVKYNGTTSQWRDILKGDYTFYRCHKLDYIQCIDGIIDSILLLAQLFNDSLFLVRKRQYKELLLVLLLMMLLILVLVLVLLILYEEDHNFSII